MYRLRLRTNSAKKLFTLPNNKSRMMEDGQLVSDDDSIVSMYPSYFVKEVETKEVETKEELLEEEPISEAKVYIEETKEVETEDEPTDTKSLVDTINDCETKEELASIIEELGLDVKVSGRTKLKTLKEKVLNLVG